MELKDIWTRKDLLLYIAERMAPQAEGQDKECRPFDFVEDFYDPDEAAAAFLCAAEESLPHDLFCSLWAEAIAILSEPDPTPEQAAKLTAALDKKIAELKGE